MARAGFHRSNLGLPRAISLICALLLCLYLGVLLPSHTHADGQDHPTCPLCAAQSLLVDHPDAFVIHLLIAIVSPLAIFLPKAIIAETSKLFSSRAPPSISIV